MYIIKDSDGVVVNVHGTEQYAEEVAAAITNHLGVDTLVTTESGVKLHEFYRNLD